MKCNHDKNIMKFCITSTITHTLNIQKAKNIIVSTLQYVVQNAE